MNKLKIVIESEGDMQMMKTIPANLAGIEPPVPSLKLVYRHNPAACDSFVHQVHAVGQGTEAWGYSSVSMEDAAVKAGECFLGRVANPH